MSLSEQPHLVKIDTVENKYTCNRSNITIAVATRNRPLMLEKCLSSFLTVKVPDFVTINYLIVENSKELTMMRIVDQFAACLKDPHSAALLHEPELGIPFARNRAIDAAIEKQCRWLIFIDDDETVDRNWLSHLISGAEAASYDLAAGPVIPTLPKEALTKKQTAIYEEYAADVQRRYKVRADHIKRGMEFRVDLATNNWIGRVASLQSEGLRFNEGMRYTGGTDTELSKRAKKAGLKLGWLPEAVVYEVVPHDRLTLKYVYDRARSQALTKYHLGYSVQGHRGLLRSFATASQKAIVGLVSVAIGSIADTRMQVQGIRRLGVSAGYLAGIFGKSSDLYKRTTGH